MANNLKLKTEHFPKHNLQLLVNHSSYHNVHVGQYSAISGDSLKL